MISIQATPTVSSSLSFQTFIARASVLSKSHRAVCTSQPVSFFSSTTTIPKAPQALSSQASDNIQLNLDEFSRNPNIWRQFLMEFFASGLFSCLILFTTRTYATWHSVSLALPAIVSVSFSCVLIGSFLQFKTHVPFLHPIPILSAWATNNLSSRLTITLLAAQSVASILVKICAHLFFTHSSSVLLTLTAPNTILSRFYLGGAWLSAIAVMLRGFPSTSRKDPNLYTNLGICFLGFFPSLLFTLHLSNPLYYMSCIFSFSGLRQAVIFFFQSFIIFTIIAMLTEKLVAPLQNRRARTAFDKLGELKSKLKELGLAGLYAYGITNFLYYGLAFPFFWCQLGFQASWASLGKAWGITWGFSQVTKPFRAVMAISIAPYIKLLMDKMRKSKHPKNSMTDENKAETR